MNILKPLARKFTLVLQHQNVRLMISRTYYLNKNKSLKRKIISILYFNRNYFFQCIEPSRLNVNELYQILLSDERCSNILLIG
ncbi:BLUF domain-containing protein [Colwellia sp. RE-S-Sl-9]